MKNVMVIAVEEIIEEGRSKAFDDWVLGLVEEANGLRKTYNP